MVRRLMAKEIRAHRSSPHQESRAFRLCDRLRSPLIRFTGMAGYRSLLTRALAMTAQRIRWMKAVNVSADGDLSGVDEARVGVPPHEVTEGEIELMTQFIGLLVTFIGEELTGRLLEEVWPNVLEDLNE